MKNIYASAIKRFFLAVIALALCARAQPAPETEWCESTATMNSFYLFAITDPITPETISVPSYTICDPTVWNTTMVIDYSTCGIKRGAHPRWVFS